MAKKFEEMNDVEKREAFEKWVSGRTSRRGESKKKRTAVQALVKAHQDEYNGLLKAAGAKAPAKKV